MIKEIEIPTYGELKLNCSVEDTESYFLMAVRKNNKKRNFLFVSQLLGKHIPIQPHVLFNACKKLTSQFANNKKLNADNNGAFICTDKTLVIGFAETATAMGHAVFDCLTGNCNYVHTTRNKVSNYEFAFEFEEEHCHAPEQLFFLEKKEWIEEAKNIIIVDDEVTTGKTIRNIIDQINQHFPGKSYSIITFLDWRNKERINAYHQFETDRKLDIHFYSLIKGSIETVTVADNTMPESEINDCAGYDAAENGWQFHYCNIAPTIKTNAENGMSVMQRAELWERTQHVSQQIKPHLLGKKRAIIGTGEFMYVPLFCAQRFDGINYFNATTRSPAIANNHPNYGIKKSMYFNCPTDTGRNEYLYNANIMECDEVVLFLENAVPKQQLHSLLSNLDKENYSYKHVVFIKGDEHK